MPEYLKILGLPTQYTSMLYFVNFYQEEYSTFITEKI